MKLLPDVRGEYADLLLQDAYMWGQRHVDCNTQHAVYHPVKTVRELQQCVNLINQTPFVATALKKFSMTRAGLSFGYTLGAWQSVMLAFFSLSAVALITTRVLSSAARQQTSHRGLLAVASLGPHASSLTTHYGPVP